MHFRHLSLVVILAFFAGCHSYMIDDAQEDLRSSFTHGNFEKSQSQLTGMQKRSLYREKDKVLWNLENGTVQHFLGNYDTSNVYFSDAELSIEDAYTKSLSRGFLSMISNDNKLVYDGEPYEDVYLNAFKALNYVHMNDFEGALVETRRMSYKMERLAIRIKGLADSFAKSDTTGTVDWEPGDVNIQNSAMAHYLSAVLYAKSGKPDDARIEFDKIGTAFQEQSNAGGFGNFDVSSLEQIKNPNTYNVLLTSFSGQAPVKYQVDLRIITDWSEGKYLKFSFPGIEVVNSDVAQIRAVINDADEVGLHLIEEMDLVATDVYRAKEPIIYSRALLRSFLKAGGTNLLSKGIAKQNEDLGAFAEVIGQIYRDASEKADLRGWQTLPGQAWMNVMQLPPGSHSVRIEYLSSYGRVLYSESFDVEITDNTHLALIESIYSN